MGCWRDTTSQSPLQRFTRQQKAIRAWSLIRGPHLDPEGARWFINHHTGASLTASLYTRPQRGHSHTGPPACLRFEGSSLVFSLNVGDSPEYFCEVGYHLQTTYVDDLGWGKVPSPARNIPFVVEIFAYHKCLRHLDSYILDLLTE